MTPCNVSISRSFAISIGITASNGVPRWNRPNVQRMEPGIKCSIERFSTFAQIFRRAFRPLLRKHIKKISEDYGSTQGRFSPGFCFKNKVAFSVDLTKFDHGLRSTRQQACLLTTALLERSEPHKCRGRWMRTAEPEGKAKGASRKLKQKEHTVDLGKKTDV